MMERKKSIGVRLRQVVKMFGSNTVLNGIDLDIAPGSLTTLLGPSGCGKTTILRLIAGLELPTSGQVFIGDDDVSTHSASQRDVAMVFQSYALFPHMTVGENVGYGLKVQKVLAPERREKVADAMASVGMSGFEERYIDQISGGQQQRIAVARALILEPHVMLFDEPLSNLDTKLRRQMREDIRRLQQETGITSVYVTHDQNEALAVSDQVVVMKEGGIAQIGPPESLYHQPNSAFVATFMGDANILGAELVVRDGSHFVCIRQVEIPLRARAQTGQPGAVRVAIRPEALSLSPASGADEGLSGIISSRAYIGSATEYLIAYDGEQLFAAIPAGERAFEPGDAVNIAINPVGVAVIG